MQGTHHLVSQLVFRFLHADCYDCHLRAAFATYAWAFAEEPIVPEHLYFWTFALIQYVVLSTSTIILCGCHPYLYKKYSRTRCILSAKIAGLLCPRLFICADKFQFAN